MRRIITGHNEKGESVVTFEGPPASCLLYTSPSPRDP